MANYYRSVAAEVDSDNDSQVSDVDPAEVAKWVEDMDDLDADLFTSAHKTQPRVAETSTSKKRALKGVSGDNEKRSISRVSFDSPNKVAPAIMTNKGSKSYDEADPLADLLSDEDSLGSKKETDKTIVASPVKPVSLGISEGSVAKKDKSKVISDLFGLGSGDAENKALPSQSSTRKVESKDNEPSSIRSPNWLGITSPLKTPSSKVGIAEVSQNKVDLSTKVPISPKKVGRDTKTEDDDDLLEKMGFGNRKVSKTLDVNVGKIGTRTSKPKFVIDGQFGGSVPSTNKERISSLNSPVKKPDGNVSQTSNPMSFGSYAPSVSTSREPRRSASRHTSSVADPLGIFSSSPSQPTSQELTTEGSSMTTMPSKRLESAPPKTSDQLSGSSESVGKPDSKLQTTAGKMFVQLTPGGDHGGRAAGVRAQVSPTHQLGNLAASGANFPEWLSGGASVVKEDPASSMLNVVQGTSMDIAAEATAIPQHPGLDNGGMLGLSLLAGARLDQEVAASLQRQEAQLVAALQVKQRQEQLAGLHRHQHELLLRQESQLQDLVERQMERQRQVESHLARQQERIATHIQALLSQPVVLPAPELPVVGITVDAAVQSSQPADVGMDRSQVQLPRGLPAAGVDVEARHKEELEMVEGLYKRHISLLESSLERLEVRLHAENTQLEEEYQAKIAKLQEEQRLLEDAHKQKVAALQEERLTDLKHMKELYQREVDDLREHHARAAAVEQDNSLQTRSLQLLCEQLGQSSAQLVMLEGKADGRQRSELDVRDAALRAKEAELKVAREALERQQLASEEEHKRLVELVADLELRAAERRAEVDARAWELRQEAAKLEARTRVLEGERQRCLAQLEHERRQVQQLKQNALDEQKQMSQQLREEQLKLSAEKSRLEAVARLQGPAAPAAMADVEEVRAEAEAAMQVALDSARRADAEREKLNEQKRLLVVEQRQLQEKERELMVRSRELDVLGEMAAATKEEGLRALKECHELQQQHAARMGEHQRQISQLKERERRLAEEKAALSQERRALQKSKEQNRFCSFCRMLLDHSGPPASSSLQAAEKHFVDPQQVILKLTGERDQDDNSHSNFLSSLISK